MSQCKVVIVEGIPGSGKTRLVRLLGKKLGSRTLTLVEPDEKENANPYLARFYEDRKRWAYTMQTHLRDRRHQMHLLAQGYATCGQGDVVIDRSIFGDVCFARQQIIDGNMTDDEFQSYMTQYRIMVSTVMYPSVCLHLHVSPETAVRRIQKRMEQETGRKCEAAIDMGYLQSLDREITDTVWALHTQGVRVRNVPWNDDLDDEALERAAEQLAADIREIEVVQRFRDNHRKLIG